MASTVPHDLQAERAVLGAVLVNAEHFHEVAATLKVGQFFRQAHQTIYQAMHDLSAKGLDIDPLTVTVHLKQIGQIENVGGPAYVFGLTDGVPQSTNVAAYGQIVANHALRAELIQVAQRIIQRAEQGADTDRELVDYAQGELFALVDQTKSDFQSGEAFVAYLAPLIDAMIAGATPRGVKTGFLTIDAIVPLLRPGNLVVLAGRPSMGKTAFALNLAQNVASSQIEGIQPQVGLFSLEMNREELGLRLVSSESGVHHSRIQDGETDDGDLAAIAQAFCTIGGSGLHVDDSPNLSLFDFRSKIRKLRARHSADLAIIDYMQLMETPKAENRNHEIAKLTRGLKLSAKELDLPIVVLSQLSRDVERRSEKRPVLADLRDSGAIEQDADLVLFVHRPEVYEPDKPELRNLAEIIVAKQRNGPTGIARLVWRKEHQRFADRSYE